MPSIIIRQYLLNNWAVIALVSWLAREGDEEFLTRYGEASDFLTEEAEQKYVEDD